MPGIRWRCNSTESIPPPTTDWRRKIVIPRMSVSVAWRLGKRNSIHSCHMPFSHHATSSPALPRAHYKYPPTPVLYSNWSITPTFPNTVFDPTFSHTVFWSHTCSCCIFEVAMAEEMILSSKGLSNGGRIPRKYTQDGQGAVKDVSPPLEWYNVPEALLALPSSWKIPTRRILRIPAPTPSSTGAPTFPISFMLSNRVKLHAN